MSESKLTAALIQFHKDVDKIEKNARANYGRFADLANVLSTVTPALLKNDLVLTQTFLEDSLVTTLRHVSGETITSVCDLVVSEGRNKTQEWGKAVTYQRRYAIVSLLGLVADMDMDGAMLEDAKPEPAKPKSKPKAAAKNPVAKKAAAPAPAPKPADDLADKQDVEAVKAKAKALMMTDPTKFEQIKTMFFDHFKIGADCYFSESFHTHDHLKFLNDLL